MKYLDILQSSVSGSQYNTGINCHELKISVLVTSITGSKISIEAETSFALH